MELDQERDSVNLDDSQIDQVEQNIENNYNFYKPDTLETQINENLQEFRKTILDYNMTTFSEDFDIAILEIYNIYNKMGKIVLGHVESSYRQNSVNEDDHELDKVKKITNTLCDTKLIIEELVFTKYADRAYADSGFP